MIAIDAPRLWSLSSIPNDMAIRRRSQSFSDIQQQQISLVEPFRFIKESCRSIRLSQKEFYQR